MRSSKSTLRLSDNSRENAECRMLRKAAYTAAHTPRKIIRPISAARRAGRPFYRLLAYFPVLCVAVEAVMTDDDRVMMVM